MGLPAVFSCATQSVAREGRSVALPAAGAPFDPEWRICARFAADDKGPIVALLTALDSLRAAKIGLRIERALGGRLRNLWDGIEILASLLAM